MSNRYDSLDRNYKLIEVFEIISGALYWLISAISLIIIYVKDENINKSLSGFFILLTLCFFIINNCLKIYIIPQVENKRRLHLLSNSLGICLDHERTNGYYNNTIKPSILKLGANVFENSLFAKTVVSKMLVFVRIRMAIYFLLFFSSYLLIGIH